MNRLSISMQLVLGVRVPLGLLRLNLYVHRCPYLTMTSPTIVAISHYILNIVRG